MVTTIEKNETSAITTSFGRMPKPSQNASTGANTADRDRLRGDDQRIDGPAQRRREVDRDRQHRSDGDRHQDPEQHLLRGDQEVAPQQRAVVVQRLARPGGARAGSARRSPPLRSTYSSQIPISASSSSGGRQPSGRRLTSRTPSAAKARSRSSRRRESVRRRGRGTATSISPPRGPGRGDITTTRSPSITASSTSWVTRTTVRGSLASTCESQPCISWRVIASSAANGSSSASTGLPGQQRAQERDALAHAARQLRRPRRARTAPARTARATAPRPCAPRARETPRARSASPALSIALSHGSSRSRWGISAAGARCTVPESGRCRPQISSSSVVLPHPLGPDDRDHLMRVRAQRHAGERLDRARAWSGNVRLTSSTRTPSAALSSRGSSAGASTISVVAPFAGITPQVLRVSAGRTMRRALSQPAFPPAPLVVKFVRGC